MMKKAWFFFLAVILAITLQSGCSKARSILDFQNNNMPAPFDLFHLFDGYPALDAVWDSVPGMTGNQKMAQMVIADIPAAADFFYILSYLMDRSENPGLGLLDDIKAAIALVTDSSERFYGNNRLGPAYNINSFYGDNNAGTYINDFYGFLDEVGRNVGGSSPKVGESVVSIIGQVMPYLLTTKTDDELVEFMEGLYMPTFYDNVNYSTTVPAPGYEVRLREGTYTTAQMTAAGITDNSISSLKVPPFYKVTLYQNDGFGGTAWTYDSSTINIGAASNQASSIRIEKDNTDMKDLAELLAQPLAMADFPMWINLQGTPAEAGDDTLETNFSLMSSRTDSGLGNMASGLQSLMYGLITLMNGETTDRAFLQDLFNNLNDALSNTDMIKRTMWNLSNYFTPTVGSSVSQIYGTLNTTTVDPDFVTGVYNTQIANTLYSNAELKETLQEFLGLAGGLFQRDDRLSSMVYKSMGTASQDYPLTVVPTLIDNLYINWDQTQLKESIYDMIRYDALGRDRTSGSPAYAASHLEHLLFVGAIAGNFGFVHIDDGREIGTGSIDATCNSADCNANRHGHGEHCGYLTLNDSLFAITSVRDALSSLGTYELAFDSGAGYISKGGQSGRIFRSRNSFSLSSPSTYRFVYDINYPALRFLSGPCAGDMGNSGGGNPSGGGGDGTNEYVPYTANGIGNSNYLLTGDLASWTFMHVARACMEGEGPYYYRDPAAGTDTINGFTGTKYLRPDGRIYALVDASDNYYYPVDGGNDVVDPNVSADGQRWNRFKPTWNTDYYAMQDSLNNNYYTPSNMNGTATTAGCLTYNEISLTRAQRECASHEEAIYRNFQWVMNEKKMVLIVPMWLYGVACGMLPVESCVYQVVEGNGLTGLSMARRYRGANVWAKANSSGTSSIPGDYRINVLAAPIRTAGGLGTIDTAKVYNDTLGRGTLTPGAVAHNIIALTRLAFPRSPLITSGTQYQHNLLGSRKFDNDLENSDLGFRAWSSAAAQGDPVWKKRNSLAPILIALIANLHAKSNTTNNAVAKMLSGLQPLIKPLVFFNYDISNSLNMPNNPTRKRDGIAENCWLARARSVGGDYRYPHSKYLMPDCNVTEGSGFDSSTSSPYGWYGGEAARAYYAPAEIPNLLSVLLDSDTTTNRGTIAQRADGLLATLTKYTAGTSGRPDEIVTQRTYEAPNTGAIRDILYGLEQLTSGMKVAKAAAIGIYEDQSTSGGTISNYTTKQLNPPEWTFTKRQRPGEPTEYIDIDAEKMLNNLKGGDDGLNTTKGLNQFHSASVAACNWTNLTNADDDGVLDVLQTMTDEFLKTGAAYPISNELFNIIDALYLHSPSQAQIKGALYNIGKLMAYYNGSPWLLQGDTGFSTLYDFLMTAVPTLDNEMALYSALKGQTKGETYRSLLTSLKNASAENGLLQFVVASAALGPYSSGDLLNDLSLWLDSDLISGAGTEFYSILSEMLQKLADIAQYAPDEVMLYSIYDQYGFQRNELR
jgi:hypothetical protein